MQLIVGWFADFPAVWLDLFFFPVLLRWWMFMLADGPKLGPVILPLSASSLCCFSSSYIAMSSRSLSFLNLVASCFFMQSHTTFICPITSLMHDWLRNISKEMSRNMMHPHLCLYSDAQWTKPDNSNQGEFLHAKLGSTYPKSFKSLVSKQWHGQGERRRHSGRQLCWCELAA